MGDDKERILAQKHALVFLDLLYPALNQHSEVYGDLNEDILLKPRIEGINFKEASNGLTLMEKYLLLTLRHDGEHLAQTHLSNGLADAIFGELLLRGIVHLTEKKKARFPSYIPYDYDWKFSESIDRPIDNEILEEAVRLMEAKNGNKMSVKWMRTLTNYNCSKGIKQLFSRSVAIATKNGLVDVQHTTTLGIFNRILIRTRDPSLQQNLIKIVREFALENKIPSNGHDYALVAFVASHMSNIVLGHKTVDLYIIFPDKDEREIAKSNMEDFCRRMSGARSTCW
eukprot:Phypoly_transcript_13892.p1 GENE.Phypoly_transcript_13892~~Phypoly_transcript_13892.p1  ORF type:complete len:284 (+),score=43.00 Phypoly_transcript_13892:81-932(+)